MFHKALKFQLTALCAIDDILIDIDWNQFEDAEIQSRFGCEDDLTTTDSQKCFNILLVEECQVSHPLPVLRIHPLFDIKHLASFEPIPRLDSHTLAQ